MAGLPLTVASGRITSATGLVGAGNGTEEELCVPLQCLAEPMHVSA